MIELLPTAAVKLLEASISPKRFTHCLAVTNTAKQLADAWNTFEINRTHLAWAGLFHDCAKEISREEERQLLENQPIEYGIELVNTPSLLHAPLGASLLKAKYQMDHPDVLNAVAYHPTGHPSIGPVGWVIYMADYLEPGRTYFPEREEILQESLKNPLQGLRRVTGLRIDTVRQMGKPLNPAVTVFKDYLDSIKTLPTH